MSVSSITLRKRVRGRRFVACEEVLRHAISRFRYWRNLVKCQYAFYRAQLAAWWFNKHQEEADWFKNRLCEWGQIPAAIIFFGSIGIAAFLAMFW